MNSTKNVALVAIGRPIRNPYSYRIPDEGINTLNIGDRVLIDLRGRKTSGLIVGFTDEKGIDFELKEITSPVDIVPLLNENSYELARWITDYYRSFIGETLNAIIPGGMDVKTYDLISISQKAHRDKEKWQNSKKLTGELLRYISERGFVSYSDILNEFDIWKSRKALLPLNYRGYTRIRPFITNPATGWKCGRFLLNQYESDLSLVESLKRSRAKKKVIDALKSEDAGLTLDELEDIASHSTIKDMLKMGYTSFILDEEEEEKPSLVDMPEATPEQGDIINSIVESGFDTFSTTLISGVTGSGKTYIYIRLCEEILKRGKRAIILVPEISLTPQTIDRFRSAFGDTAEVIHSAQTKASRFEVWRKSRLNLISCLIGPRSAVLTPLSDLGLIVVDEEHDASYKQSDREPRYNARDVSILRGEMEDFPVILGSATPSVESYYQCEREKYRLYTLTKRIFDHPLPEIEILNLNREDKYRNSEFFTKKLVEGIFETLSEDRQVILLQNRRGFATVLVCAECGNVFRCPNCDVTLTYHKSTHSLVCHYCGKSRGVPEVCPECDSENIEFYGIGTERVYEELESILSDYKIVRMDSDTTRKTGSHSEILESFRSGENQVLIGTQMVSQGLDFPDVGLVGVISADTSLCFPDFMAGERTFQLLMHISGRSGRSPTGGRAIIQTLHPNHYAIRFAYQQDYKSFYEYEINYRRTLGYPPITRMASILIEDRRKDVAREQAENLRELLVRIVSNLKLSDKAVIRGPAPAPISRLRGFHRWQILITTTDVKTRRDILDGMNGVKLGPQGKWGKIVLDVDPVDLL